MKVAVAVLGLLMSVEPATVVETRHEVVVREVERVRTVETPYADSLLDFEEIDRQNGCLWEFLQAHETELTLEAVIAAGDWTDANGGACAMIGED